MFGVRPCFRRLERDGKMESQAGQGRPVSLDMLWSMRERERFEVCETCGWDELSAAEWKREKTYSVVICLLRIRLSFEGWCPCLWWRARGRRRHGGVGRTGQGAGCFDKGISPSTHALHARAVRIVCPRDGLAVKRGVVWGDDGGAIGGAVLIGVGGGGIGRRRGGAGGGRVYDGGYAAWRGGCLHELDDLNGVGLAEVEMAGVWLEWIAVEHVHEGGGGGGRGMEHDSGHLERKRETTVVGIYKGDIATRANSTVECSPMRRFWRSMR
jgi:hypothetical protein